jgi:hypothetical protein
VSEDRALRSVFGPKREEVTGEWIVAILTRHAPVGTPLCSMGLFDGDPTCRFCRKETETLQHIICRCEALARRRFNVFGNPVVEPKDISTDSVMDLCLFIRGRGPLLNVC